MRAAVILLLVVALSVVTALAVPSHHRTQGPVKMTGLEDVTSMNAVRPADRPLDEGGTPNSTWYVTGTTWYDYQTNGTHGKQINLDELGYVHQVWTNGLDAAIAERHVFYNVWDPSTQTNLFTGGVQCDASTRAGFANVIVKPDGFGFPIFHQIAGGASGPHSAAAIDFLPLTGAFTGFDVVPYVGAELQIIWPHGDMDINGDIHMMSTESGGASGDYYSKATPIYDSGFGLEIQWGDGYTEWPAGSFITNDVACSRTTERVAVAWVADPVVDNDGTNVMLRISEDAGENWGEPINVTGCIPIDLNCMAAGGDWITCNQDTFRPWLDLSVILDDDDYVHVAYTAHGWYYYDETGAVGPNGYVYSSIWHWGEERQEFNLMNLAWFANDSVALGVNNLMCDRPNLAIDTTTDNLYCSFRQFDQHAYSDQGFPMGEFYMTVSTDNGQNWAVPTNVSNTPGEPGQVTGNDPSERDITLAKYVSDGIIHAQYQHDYAAGSNVAASGAEGPPSLNDIVYMRVPVSDIPTTPLVEPYPFRFDSTGFPTSSADERAELPSQFTLYQNYPNPFNPTTAIQFDLARSANVTLKVFDVTGREVRSLLTSESLSAGAHVVNFDATGLSSGVYFYRLDANGISETKKMVLMK